MCLTAAVAADWVNLPRAAEPRAQQPSSHTASPVRVVVMGVSGSGKSALASRLALALGAEFVEGDELHPRRNVDLMAAGIALTDDDRHGWLHAIAEQLFQARLHGRSIVISCSALKRRYRDLLRLGAADTRFIHLHGSAELLSERLGQRAGHYMPASLLPSQLLALEAPDADEGALSLGIEAPVERLLEIALSALSAATAPAAATSMPSTSSNSLTP